jgi:hypothetical protein
MADLSDYAWLTGDEASKYLAQAAELHGVQGQSRLLRADLGSERARLVMEQAELRRIAVRKFRNAGRMFFTRRGLEQATDEWIARSKADRFSGSGQVLDLCCGLGGDLMSLARVGRCTGVDRDEIMCLLAQRNLEEAAPPFDFSIRHEDAQAIQTSDFGAWHVDPDRRRDGRRSTNPQRFSPSLDWLSEWLGRHPHGAVKLAPGTRPPAPWERDYEFEWLGRGGECKQLLAWSGRLARAPGRRTATIVNRTGEAIETLTGIPESLPPTAERPLHYLFEPDPTVLAAGLSGFLARELNLSPLDRMGGYLTGAACASHLGTWFEIVDVLPFDRRRVKSWCRLRGVGQLVVKKRGVDVDPARLSRELSFGGDGSAVMILFRGAKGVTAVMARPMDPLGAPTGDASSAGGRDA